jgi:hypothetical protein
VLVDVCTMDHGDGCNMSHGLEADEVNGEHRCLEDIQLFCIAGDMWQLVGLGQLGLGH